MNSFFIYFIFFNMSKIDDFKLFVSKNPNLVDYVKKKNISWQNLFEIYDLYGEKDSIWKKYTIQESSTLNIKNILNTIKNININSLEENINSISKADGLVDELTKKEETEKTE